MNVIESACNCGEPISIEIGAERAFRHDGKRPFYTNDRGFTQLRCRKCRGWLADTCADAAYDKQASHGLILGCNDSSALEAGK